MSRHNGLHRRLNSLLTAPEGKWHEIFLGMHELAVCVSSRLRFSSNQDCEDAISSAVIFAMEHLNTYDSRRCSAVAYFARVMMRHMIHLLQENGRQPLLHDAILDDEPDSSILDRAVSHRMPGRPATPDRQYRLSDADAIRKVRRLLDTSLARSLEALESSAEQTQKDQARICLMLLQQIRKLLLGRFNRIAADHSRLGEGAPPAAAHRRFARSNTRQDRLFAAA